MGKKKAKPKGTATSQNVKAAREAIEEQKEAPTVPTAVAVEGSDQVEPHTVVCPECNARRSMPSIPVRAGVSTVWVCQRCGIGWDIRHQFRRVHLGDADAEAQDLEAENAELRQEVNDLKRWVADLQDGYYINCVYCGHRFGPAASTPSSQADLLTEHVETCPKHPLHGATRENTRLKSVDLYFVRNRRTKLYSLCFTLAEAERLAKAAKEPYVRCAHEFPKHEVGVRNV